MFKNKEINQRHEKHQESSLFGKGCNFTGTIDASENVRVDGQIIGEIKTKAKLVAGESSRIEGNIQAEKAEISGEVIGDIVVSETLVLRSSAKIDGDIYTDKLIMDEGASFNGKCKVGEQGKQVLMEASKNAKSNGLNGRENNAAKEFIPAAG